MYFQNIVHKQRWITFLSVLLVISSMYIYIERSLSLQRPGWQRNIAESYVPVGGDSWSIFSNHGQGLFDSLCESWSLPKQKLYVKRPWDRRNCSLSETQCRKVLLSGVGYSGTGFFSKVFTELGCDIGHECMDKYGVSDWRRSFEPIDGRMFFTHKFVQVRHPLAHVRSFRGTKWNFGIPSYYNCSQHKSLTKNVSPQERSNGPSLHFKNFTLLKNATLWSILPGDVQMLDFWTVGNIRALSSANMWWKLENVDENLLEYICKIIPCPSCNVTQIKLAIDAKTGHNKHRKEDNLPDWSELCSDGNSTWAEVTKAISTICKHARSLCASLQYENC